MDFTFLHHSNARSGKIYAEFSIGMHFPLVIIIKLVCLMAGLSCLAILLYPQLFFSFVQVMISSNILIIFFPCGHFPFILPSSTVRSIFSCLRI